MQLELEIACSSYHLVFCGQTWPFLPVQEHYRYQRKHGHLGAYTESDNVPARKKVWPHETSYHCGSVIIVLSYC